MNSDFPLRLVAAVLLATLPALLQAQVTLPPVRVPTLPVELPDLERTVRDTGEMTTRELRNLRRVQVRELIRRNRSTLEAGPGGVPILRSEVLALSPGEPALERARGAGFTIARQRPLEGLDTTMVVLQAPPGMSTRRALQTLRNLDPEGVYDFNHVYTRSGTVQPGPQAMASLPAAAPAAAAAKLGLIDGGIDAAHAVFGGAELRVHGCTGATTPSDHGTAVASLLVGRAGTFQGAAPRGRLYAADVYCGSATGGAVDAVADAFAWLAREQVPVINVSLVGPPNAMLEQVIRILLLRGHLIVAAVGNDGPAARPLYPAAYPGVVGVTAVDARDRVLPEAGRGPHVAFAAPGANMAAAASSSPFAAVRGTSFAAPLVAGLLAAGLPAPDKAIAEKALAALIAQAVDLGKQGRDPVYGNGLVGRELRVEPQLARLEEKQLR